MGWFYLEYFLSDLSPIISYPCHLVLLDLPFILLKPLISGNESSNPQYFWQQIDELCKSSIFLATNWPALYQNPEYFWQQIDQLYLQILNISDNKLTSSPGIELRGWRHSFSMLTGGGQENREKLTIQMLHSFWYFTRKRNMKTTDISYHLFFSNLMLFLADNLQFLFKGQSLTRKPTRSRLGLSICQNCAVQNSRREMFLKGFELYLIRELNRIGLDIGLLGDPRTWLGNHWTF